MKYEIGSFMISMKYYIAKRSQRYFLSWDTPRKEKNDIYIYIYDNKDWARHNQIGDWQLHNINEILYRHKKKTIFHMMRYIQKEQKRFIYTHMKMRIERETNKCEIGNFMILMKYYIAKKKKDDISYHEIHPKQQKWYIYT